MRSEMGRKAFWLALLAIIMLSTIECRNADFRTIDEIRVVQLEEVQGALGHLIEFTVEKKGFSNANKATFKVALLVRDEDISQNNFYIILTLITDSSSPEHAKYADIFNLFERSTGLSTTTLPNDEQPLMLKVGSGTVQAHFDRCLVIQTPMENVCLKLNLGIGKSLTDKIERLVQGGAEVIDIGLTPDPPPVVDPPVVEPPDEPSLEPLVHPDQEFWAISRVSASLDLQQLSDGMAFASQGLSEERIIAWYEEGLLSVDLLESGIDFILYDLYGICLQERPEIAAKALREGGIIIHPLARNGLVFDWFHLAHGYPDKSKDERLVLFRRLVRFWGVDPLFGERSINGLPIGAPVLPKDYIYIQPPANPFLTVNEREVKNRLEDIDQEAQQLLADHTGLSVIKIYNAALSSDFGILVDFIFTDLWNIYRAEQPEQAATVSVDDIPLHPISGNGLLFSWLVLQYDNPDKSKDERLLLFRRLVREGGVQVILAE